MQSERLGLVGGLAADRPVLVAILFSFGLSTLTIAGVFDARDAGVGSADIAGLLIALLVLPAAPLALASVAPRRPAWRAAYAVAVAAGLFALDGAMRFLPAPSPPLDRRLLVGSFLLTAFLTVIGPVCGAYLRLAFIGAVAAVLGAAGAGGLLRLETAQLADIGLPLTLGVALAIPVAIGVVADFSRLFARGADRRTAAGRASDHSASLALVVILIGASGLALLGLDGALVGQVWALGAAAALSALAALFATGGALSLHQAGESVAVEENTRAQALRLFWRPLRRALPVRTAFAALAVTFVLLVVAAFDLALAPTPGQAAFLAAVTAISGVVLFSVRVGLFVAFATVCATALTRWIGAGIGVAPPPPEIAAAAACFVAALFAQFALAWRDARSPRLNARETMEAAMTDGAGRFVVGLAAGAGAFYAADVAGAADGAAAGAGWTLCLGLVGALIAPALMTALSGVGGRDSL